MHNTKKKGCTCGGKCKTRPRSYKKRQSRVMRHRKGGSIWGKVGLGKTAKFIKKARRNGKLKLPAQILSHGLEFGSDVVSSVPVVGPIAAAVARENARAVRALGNTKKKRLWD